MAIDTFAEVSFSARALPDSNDEIFMYEIFEAYTALV